MDIRSTPEIERMVRHHLASGAYGSPQSVLTEALHALQKLESIRMEDEQDVKREHGARTEENTPEILPIVRWLQETAKPRMGRMELRWRLSGKFSGTMAQTVSEGRDDRV